MFFIAYLVCYLLEKTTATAMMLLIQLCVEMKLAASASYTHTLNNAGLLKIYLYIYDLIKNL